MVVRGLRKMGRLLIAAKLDVVITFCLQYLHVRPRYIYIWIRTNIFVARDRANLLGIVFALKICHRLP